MIRDQGPPPPNRLLAELDRRGIAYQVGRVIVGAARGDEAPIREALAAAGVSRDPVYNRGALMLLPAGISKGTGVQHALRFLGLSFHDVLAFGDAENDLPFFEVCGWPACPADGMWVVKEQADLIFPGENGEAVAAAVVGPVLQGLLPVQFSVRHRIPLGWGAETSEPVAIPARGVNVLVHGDPLSGKSWLAGALVERLVAARYAVWVIDPEGDYQVPSRLAAVTWATIHSEQEMVRLLSRFERNLGASVIADLSALPPCAESGRDRGRAARDRRPQAAPGAAPLGPARRGTTRCFAREWPRMPWPSKSMVSVSSPTSRAGCGSGSSRRWTSTSCRASPRRTSWPS